LWTEVDDFHASGPGDRHYILDHDDGTVVFGDGVHALIPPAGVDNVRFAQYRTGGGSLGNVPAAAITQIKTTIPYVERVTNPVAATGGVDAESEDEYRERAPAVLRHQHRAVTVQDYEDLACVASAEVARAKCLPVTDFTEGAPQVSPGSVTLVVVPRAPDPRPTPSLALLDRVHAFVSARQLPSVRLGVRGPEYVAIDVDADVVVSALDRVTDIDVAIQRAIAGYLDPLRGGPQGRGWAFGRAPHRSDFFSLIAAVDGVDHVRSVRIAMQEERPGLLASSRFLICVGAMRMWFYSE
jgi:predicted phage baseplate assembly protein